MQAGEGVLSPKAGRRLPAKGHDKPPDGRHEEAQVSEPEPSAGTPSAGDLARVGGAPSTSGLLTRVQK